MSNIENAKLFVNLGLNVRVLSSNSKVPPKDSTFISNEETLKQLEKNPKLNYGVIAGEYCIVDVDLKDRYSKNGELTTSKEDAIDKFDTLSAEFPELFETLSQKSPSGGYHFFFELSDKSMLPQTAGLDGYIDIRRKVGYVVGAGSSIEGQKYKFLDKTKPIKLMTDALLQRLDSMYKKPKEKKEKQQPKPEEPQDNTKYAEQIETIKKMFGVGNLEVVHDKEKGTFKLTCLDGSCFVSKGHQHSTVKHSCMHINRKCTTVMCFSHGNDTLDEEDHSKVRELFLDKVEKHKYFNNKYFEKLCKDSDYELQKKYFEQYVCKVLTPEPMFIRLDKFSFYKPIALEKAFEEFPDFIKRWKLDTNKRSYIKTDFFIRDCPEEVFNLFEGFDIDHNYTEYKKEEQMKLIQPILDHMKGMFSCEASYNYHIKWFAYVMQKRGRTGVCVVWISPEGSGKGFMYNCIFKKMIGGRYTISSGDGQAFYDKHAEGLVNRILVNPDEVEGKDTFANSEKLKSYITEPEITCNPKNVRPFVVNNFANFLMTTNNDTPVKISMKDRRFFVDELNDAHRIDKEYYDNLIEYMDWKVLSAFYDYLKSIDVSKFNFQKDRPVTEAYKQIKDACVPLHYKFLVDLVNDEENFEHGETQIGATLFLNNFIRWCKDNNYGESKTNMTTFGRMMQKIDGIEKIHTRKGNAYNIKVEVLKTYLKKQGLLHD